MSLRQSTRKRGYRSVVEGQAKGYREDMKLTEGERSNKTGRNYDLFAPSVVPASRGRLERLRSLVLVNTHVLTEIVVATECLITTRERTYKCWIRGANQYS